ncbi:MAG TPA: sensor histidine kinase [Chryseolinea sp.]|nr:sensor histidine kinase [Chryseolinea sp.]
MSFSIRVQQLVAKTLTLLLVSTLSFGQAPYLLTDADAIHRIDKYVEVFVDTSNAAKVDDVLAGEFQSHFYPSHGNLTFGYLKSTIWLKVTTRESSPGRQWYLEIPAPFLEYVDFYQHDNNTWHHSIAGYYRAHHLREVSHTNHVLPLEFGENGISTVYIKIDGRSPKTFPLNVVEKGKFVEKTRLEDLGYGIFFGILFVMFFYNLFIYFTLRQTNYLLYICTIVCTFFIFSSASGYAGKFLWPESPVMNYYGGRLSLGVLAIFLAIFTIRFLEVRQYSKVMYYILLTLIPLAVFSIVLVATETLSSAGNNLLSIATVAFMLTGIVCRIRGNKTATYFIVAWTIYLIGGLLLTLRNSGVFDFNFWTTHFVEIGAALETMLIAFALGDRYRRLKREKEEAQALALQLQQEATFKLEVNVKERTEQLYNANQELQVIVETNKKQTKIIEDKNAELDAFFYRISHDLKGPIASLLGLSELAKMEVKDDSALGYLEKQHSQVERLNNIITGLINLTQLNHADLCKQEIEFEKMIDECIGSFQGIPNFSSIIFRRIVEPDIRFQTEWTLLNAILQNLIENAIKYSRGQSPHVEIRVQRENGHVVLEVEDNGQGIAQEHQVRIFEMFFRATPNASGRGLGLYILKRSVDKLQGTIDIRSEVGLGSTFTVRLPLKVNVD